MESFKETWQEVPRPKARAHNNCYRNPAIWSRHIAKQRFWFSTSAVTAMQNFSMQVLFGRLERWSNSQKSPKIPPQLDIVSEFKPRIWDPKSIQFEALSLQLKFKFGKKKFQQTYNNIAKERNNSHLYFKCLKNLLVSLSCSLYSRTRDYSTGKLVSTPEKRLSLPGKIDDVIVKWKKHGTTRYPYTDFGVS